MQLQSALCLPFQTGAADKAFDPDLLSHLQRTHSCGELPGQQHGQSGLYLAGVSGFFLPGPVFKPESLAWHTGGGVADRLDLGDLSGQDTAVLLRAQLTASSFSPVLTSGDASVTASSRRITRWRIMASLKRKVFSSSAKVAPSHSMLSMM